MFGTWSKNPSPGAAALGTGVGFLTGNPALGQGVSNVVSAGIQMSQKAMSAYLGALPSQGAVLGRASSYYRATISQGGGMGMNAAMQSTTLDAFRGGGLSYAGADADVARYLSQRGMIGSSSAYLDVVKSTAYAGKYLNMDNMTAATAFEGMTSGSMSSNLLSMGVYTSDSKGQARSTGDIFGDIYSRLTAGQGKATVSQTLESIRRGKLGVSINNMGFSDAQKELFQQFAISKAKGQTLDFGNVDQLENLVGGQIYQGNRNPEGALQQINYENTRVMKETTDAFIDGLELAIPAVKIFTDGMIAYGNAGGKAMATLQTMLDTIGTSSGGKAAYGFTGDPLAAISNIPGLSDLAAIASIPALINSAGTMLFGSLFNTNTYASNADSPIPRSTPISPTGGRRYGGVGGPSGGSDGAGMTRSASSGTSIGRPVAGSITSGYGPRKHPITGQNGTHNGIDIGATTGTTVRAAADGKVSSIGQNMDKKTGYGNSVTLDHDDGYQTLYAHLSKVSVAVNQRVSKGEKIGEVGETGAANGPHLHFEVRKNGSFIDPSTVMGKNVSAVSGNTKSAKSAEAAGAEDARPAWMQAGSELVANRLGNSGYLPIEQSSAVSSAFAVPSALSGKPSSSGPGMGGGKAMLALPKNRSFLDVDSLQAQYLKGGASGGSSLPDKSSSKVTINVTVAQSTPAEARRLAEMVKQYIDDDVNIGMMRNR
jgi:murein DD-endopeptidase MepM/ murein hydrolase activator NlpD